MKEPCVRYAVCLFIYSVPVILQILRERPPRLLFEEAHQMAGVGEMEIIRQFADGVVGEEQFVLQLFNRRCFSKWAADTPN